MEEANEEAEHKGWCDTELSTNEQTRKEKTSAVETLHAEIDELTASIAKGTQVPPRTGPGTLLGLLGCGSVGPVRRGGRLSIALLGRFGDPSRRRPARSCRGPAQPG